MARIRLSGIIYLIALQRERSSMQRACAVVVFIRFNRSSDRGRRLAFQINTTGGFGEEGKTRLS